MRIRFPVKGNDFAFTKHRFRCVAVTARLHRANVYLCSPLKQRASEHRTPCLRTVSGPLSRSIAFTEEFQVAPSVQRAWNARMVVCIYASVEIQVRRVKSISDPCALRPRIATCVYIHVTCLHSSRGRRHEAREDRDVTRVIYRSSSNIAARGSEREEILSSCSPGSARHHISSLYTLFPFFFLFIPS